MIQMIFLSTFLVPTNGECKVQFALVKVKFLNKHTETVS